MANEPTETTDPPQTEEDLWKDYDKDEIRRKLHDWLNDPPVGKEIL